MHTPQTWFCGEVQQNLSRLFVPIYSLSFGMLLLRRSSDTGQGSSRPESAQQEAAPANLPGSNSLDASKAVPQRSASGAVSSQATPPEHETPSPRAEGQKGPSKLLTAQPTARVAHAIAAAISPSSQDDASSETRGRLEAMHGPEPEAQPAKGAVTVPEEGCSLSEPIKAALGRESGAASCENTNGHPRPEPSALPASKGRATSAAQEPSTPSGAGSAPQAAQAHTPTPEAKLANEPGSAADQGSSQAQPTAVDGKGAAGAVGALPASANGTADAIKASSAATDAAKGTLPSKGSTAAAEVNTGPAKTPPEKTDAAQDVKEGKVSMPDCRRPLMQGTCPVSSSSAGLIKVNVHLSAKWRVLPVTAGKPRRNAHPGFTCLAGASRQRRSRQWPCHCSPDTFSRGEGQEQWHNAS